MKTLNYILFFVSFWTFTQIKAQGKFYASAPSTAYIDENFKVVFVLENLKGSNFTPPNFEGFQIVSGPNQSSSYQNFNGSITSSLSIYYILRPFKEGNLSIPPASVLVNGKTLYTETLKIAVKPAKPKQNNSNPTQNNSGTTNSNPTANGNWKEQAANNLFVKLYADNTQPYIGEQIFVYAKIYQRINTYGMQVTEMPTFDGFWKEEIDVSQAQEQIEEYNGVKYQTYLIGKFALFPLKEGILTLEPVKMTSILLINEPTYENFFGMRIPTSSYKQVQYNFASEALNIKVKPLPLEGQPENYFGAVGKFSLESYLDSSEINLGNACQYQLKLSGKGNLMALDAPEIKFPKQFSVFDPEIEENISTKLNYIQGSVQYNYVLVPEKPGTYNIPSLKFSYFDIETKTYKSIETASFTLNVKGELKEDEMVVEKLISNEPYPLKSKNSAAIEKSNFVGSKAYFISYSAPILLYFIFLFGMKKRDENLADYVSLKNRRAAKEAQRRMKVAKTYLQEQHKSGFYNEVFNVLNQYVSDKLNIPPSQISKEYLWAQFAAKNVSEQNTQAYFSILKHAEEALYSPISQDKMQEDYDTLIQLIIKIEHELA